VTVKCVSSVTVSVSVVIPCYCCTSTIIRAVDSVASQTIRPKQVILVDDASDDDGATLRVLYALKKKYVERLGIEVFHLEDNGGPSAARNAGWEVATEFYIAFLDADDSWLPQKLEVQYQWMKKNPEIDLCGHLCRWEGISRASDSFDLRGFSIIEVKKRDLLLRNAFSTPTVMLRKDVDLRFPENMRYAEDYFLWLEAVCQGYKAVRLETPLAILYKPPFGSSGLSGELWKMEHGVQEVFSHLHHQHLLNIMEAGVAKLVSLTKFLWRIFRARRLKHLEY